MLIEKMDMAKYQKNVNNTSEHLCQSTPSIPTSYQTITKLLGLQHIRQNCQFLFINRLDILWCFIVFFSVQFNNINCQVCGPPAVPLNTKVKTLSTNDWGIGEAIYECDTGYELFGTNTTKCNPKTGWEKDLPFCGINVAYRKPVNQSSSTRQGSGNFANDGKLGNQNPDAQECSETQKEPSPWWRVNLLTPQIVRIVRITTRGCCGHSPIQDLEIRVGNSSMDLQRNPLCAWYPGTVDEGTTKTFTCARPLIGQYVAIQIVGVESSLSLCEVEVFSNDEFSPERCASLGLNGDTVLATFANTCYEFHITRGESFDKAQQICQSHGGDLLNNFYGATKDYIISELDRRKNELRTQLVWIGAQKEPGLTSRIWKWVNGEMVLKPTWGKDQPNNYNGEQNCVVLDGGRNWLWNDVGCNLDYLHFICQHKPLSCGSPNINQNTTVTGRNFTVGNEIEYSCPKGHSLVGDKYRQCNESGFWSGSAPSCKYIDCGSLPQIMHGGITLSENRTTFGVTATYICHENYTLIGNENRTCELIGWSGSQPQCLIDWCPEPPVIMAGRVTVSGRRAGSTAIYECNNGHVMIGEAVISCGLGGEWTGRPPICKFVDCGTPPRPDRGNLKLTNSTTTVGSRVSYQCDEDYWLVGPAELLCTKDGKWSGEVPICELITCDTPHVPPGSYVVGYDYNIHSTIEYHCDPGYILRGEPILRCMDNGEWSHDSPLCEYVDCGLLQTLPYGSIKYIQNTTYVRSDVFYSCTNSHKLNGPERRTCLETGTWSESSPRCEEIRCNEPILAPHSILSVTGNDRMYGRTLIRTSDTSQNNIQTYKIGALAKYRCERGYKIIGEPLVTCEESGQWSGQVPECIYVDCQNPESIKNGIVTLATNATYYGAAVLYECNENYKLDGVSRRLCQEDGVWAYEAPECVEITCREPDLSANLLIEQGKRGIGAIGKFTCNKGWYIIGNHTRTCQPNGQWSGKLPNCKVVDCQRPAPIENGRIIVLNESTIYGGSAEYHCIPNYSRIGPYLRKCMENGKWSGAEPRCELVANDSQENSGIGTSIAVAASVIIILLILIGLIVLHRNKARPVKNTENIQAAEKKEEQNAAVMSYSSLENNRRDLDMTINRATFNTFQPNGGRNNNGHTRSVPENIYDQIPSDTYYDAPYEMRTNDEVYEPEPVVSTGHITINGITMIR